MFGRTDIRSCVTEAGQSLVNVLIVKSLNGAMAMDCIYAILTPVM